MTTRLQHLQKIIAIGGLLTISISLCSQVVQAKNQWQILPDMGIFPLTHKPVVQANGKVLIACADYPIRDSKETGIMPKQVLLFAPETRSWEKLPELPTAMLKCAATPLANGDILVTGGEVNFYTINEPTEDQYIARTYHYSATSKKWQRLADMPNALINHSAIALIDGHVLVTGGATELDSSAGNTSPFVNSKKAIRYDVANNTWQELAPLNTARSNHQSFSLPDGRVLVAGGDLDCKNASVCAYAEIYNPKTNQWQAYPIPKSDIATNWTETATALTGNQLYVVGAYKAFDSVYPNATIRENILPLMSLDIETGLWQEHLGWPVNGYLEVSIAALLDGRILLSGGYYLVEGADEVEISNAVYLYSPKTKTWQADEPLNPASTGQAMTTLNDGRILITGGWSGFPFVPDTWDRALLFTPVTSSAPATPEQVYKTHSEDGYINLRAEPNTKAKILKKLANDVILTGIKTDSQWLYVKDAEGINGYVHSSQIITN